VRFSKPNRKIKEPSTAKNRPVFMLRVKKFRFHYPLQRQPALFLGPGKKGNPHRHHRFSPFPIRSPNLESAPKPILKNSLAGSRHRRLYRPDAKCCLPERSALAGYRAASRLYRTDGLKFLRPFISLKAVVKLSGNLPKRATTVYLF